MTSFKAIFPQNYEDHPQFPQPIQTPIWQVMMSPWYVLDFLLNASHSKIVFGQIYELTFYELP